MNARKLAVAVGVTLAIVVPIAQAAIDFGMEQATFSAQGDDTLRAAGYAFSIWGLIYLALAIYAAGYARATETPALRALAWPAATASGLAALWIIAAALNLLWATVAIIVLSAAAAIVGLLRASPLARGRERVWALWPVALLAGWLTTAAPINLLTVMTAMDMIGEGARFGAAVLGLAAVVIVGAGIGLRARSFVYPLPIAWGLVGVYVAERGEKPTVAVLAAGAAVLMLVAAALSGWKARRASL